MIVEIRTYVIKFGFLDQFIDLYQSTGKTIQWRELGTPVGYYVSEIGPLNRVIHLWRYTSFEDRLERRARLKGDADWGAFLSSIAPILISQDSQLMLEVNFDGG